MFNRILNALDNLLTITATIIGLAAPVAIMCAYWILCSSH